MVGVFVGAVIFVATCEWAAQLRAESSRHVMADLPVAAPDSHGRTPQHNTISYAYRMVMTGDADGLIRLHRAPTASTQVNACGVLCC